MMTTQQSILAGAAVIAVAIVLHAAYRAPAIRFQETQFQQGLVARMDTLTGKIDLCGHMELATDLMWHPDDAAREVMKKAGTTDAQIEGMVRMNAQMAMSTHCLKLSDGEPTD